MNNDDCLLVEVINKNYSIAVEFGEWLTIKCDDEILRQYHGCLCCFNLCPDHVFVGE